MPITRWRYRAAIAGGAAAVGMAVLPPASSAETDDPPTPPSAPTTQYAPITLSQEESQRLCGEVLPRLADRVTRLSERVTGGPDVRGSAAWLAERAENQRAKGHPRIAERLDERAERRAGRIDQLNRVEQRLDGFRSKHCRPISGTK